MTQPVDADRRALIGGLLPATFSLCAAASASPVLAAAQALDTATRTWLRLVGDPTGRTVYSTTEGMVWGFKPQADDLTIETFAKRLYGYRSLVARKIRIDGDGAYALTTKGWTFYLDPVSRQPVAEIWNPYTAQMVSCPPLSGAASTALYSGEHKAPGLDLSERRIGEHAFVEVDRLSRFKPSDTTWFKLEADLTSYACSGAQLDRGGTGFLPSTWSHNLVAEWQTWMKMHGEPGHILFKGDGANFASADAIPPALTAAVEQHFPNTLSAVRAWH